MTMIITPRSALQGQLMPFDLRNGLSQEQAYPEIASVTQYLGAFVFATNVGLLLGIPNRPGAIEIRRTAYATFAALEITYIVIILWQLCVAGQSATGVSMEKALWAYLVPMSVACGLRLWTLFVRPDWMGRQANGQPKQKVLSADKEKKVQAQIAKLDAETDDVDDTELDDEHRSFRQRGQKRRRIMQNLEAQHNDRRRTHGSEKIVNRINTHTEQSKRRYDELYYEEALQEVRERELYAEKERKKDMQRKRRREKSMAVTMEAKKAALEKARLAEDDDEKARHLRDAERANKKAQQTKLILQKGIKGPARNLELNLEGGTMSTFQASDMEPGTKTKGKGRGGPRPKKSKEQKQAEKDSAEAAQRALDAGEELPPKDESKIRIKLNKSKSKDKEKKEKKDKDKDKEKEDGADVDATEADEEVKEPKEPKPAKEKVEEPPSKDAKFQTKGYNQIYDQIWRDLARKDVNKTFKLAAESYQIISMYVFEYGTLLVLVALADRFRSLLLALCIMSLAWQWRRASKGELDNPPKVHPAAYHTSMPMPNPVG
ncbi:predicted protein [Verticillium alfalfae VaMs.102]|uniref:Predicted protein n=1 Tax=Verticillium alfalfae (strain VaMs.102 / ATCC MYA-4576 / FGSC 10136) TaxID=526221 RepID=C9SXH0_VERA1|nr:predicted protein [Verticillium alfalfae VaMs.102]EEY23360.1 predicted protein [Verticillium alfalfae VaMs.102]